MQSVEQGKLEAELFPLRIKLNKSEHASRAQGRPDHARQQPSACGAMHAWPSR